MAELDFHLMINPLKVKGLVFGCWGTVPENTEVFMTLVTWLTPTESLKIRVPHLNTLDEEEGEDDDDDFGRMSRKFFYRFAEMTKLCELWLSDGRTRIGGQGEPVYSEAELEVLAAKVAGICPKLVYLRILDTAWDVVRKEGKSGQGELRRMTEWEMEHNVPYAFDFERLPNVV